MTIFCDICERTAKVQSETTAQRAGWFIAEFEFVGSLRQHSSLVLIDRRERDEPDAIDRHGICPKCAKQMDE